MTDEEKQAALKKRADLTLLGLLAIGVAVSALVTLLTASLTLGLVYGLLPGIVLGLLARFRLLRGGLVNASNRPDTQDRGPA